MFPRLMATATVEPAKLVTLKDVPLLEVGIEYPASTGPFTVTAEMLQEVIDSQEDPNVPATRLKIGHIENPIDDDLQALWEQMKEETDQRDSEPAVGTVANMHLDDTGMILLGDLVGIPQWLADIMASAYPARSIEGGQWRNDANNKEYAFCLQALSLLGVAWPGCTSLADLQTLFSEEGPDVTVIEMSGGRMGRIQAQVNVEDVRRAFYEDFAQGDRFWWWDRAILLEPNEMIINDPDTGQLYRLPFKVSGEETEFSDPIPVKIVYEDTGPPEKDGEPKAVIQMAALPNLGKVVAKNKTRAEAYVGFRSTTDQEEVEASMDPKEIRSKLGLAEDASDEEVMAKLDAVTEEPEGDPEDEGTPKPEEPEGEPKPGEPAPPAPETPQAGVRTLDEDTYQKLVKGAETAEQLAAGARDRERDDTIAAAVKDGKFAPSRREHWSTLWDNDPEGTKATIASLAAGVIPVTERGSSKTGESTDASAAYDRSWLTPQERERVTKAEASQLETPRVTVGA